MRLVLGHTNGRNSTLEGSLQLRVELDSLGHRVVVQLVGEDDSTGLVESSKYVWKYNTKFIKTYAVEGTVLSACDEVLVVGVHLRGGDVGRADLPVIGVVAPEDGAEPETLGDGTDTVISVTERRSPAGRGNASSELDGIHLIRIGK